MPSRAVAESCIGHSIHPTIAAVYSPKMRIHEVDANHIH
jgi:hypothetical protein